ncbi:MAG: hypothetical protein AB2L14_27415 [Candidatus Xenobiia bacterium LiM19]
MSIIKNNGIQRMFYTDEPGAILRFGDIIQGFVCAIPNIEQPFSDHLEKSIKIDVSFPTFYSSLTPCCSVGDSIITLTPLKKIKSGFYSNPYFIDDFTRINREMEPNQSVPPQIWDSETFKCEREKKLKKGKAFAFLETFVYEGHALLPNYTIKTPSKETVETNYYMIDFRDVFQVRCKKIEKSAPIDTKILELTAEAREDLRQKISFYYSRQPDEDRVLLQS